MSDRSEANLISKRQIAATDKAKFAGNTLCIGKNFNAVSAAICRFELGFAALRYGNPSTEKLTIKYLYIAYNEISLQGCISAVRRHNDKRLTISRRRLYNIMTFRSISYCRKKQTNPADVA